MAGAEYPPVELLERMADSTAAPEGRKGIPKGVGYYRPLGGSVRRW
jgi:hypothetical protein